MYMVKHKHNHILEQVYQMLQRMPQLLNLKSISLKTEEPGKSIKNNQLYITFTLYHITFALNHVK